MKNKIQESFYKIDHYCSNLLTSELNYIQKNYEKVFHINTFDELKKLT